MLTDEQRAVLESLACMSSPYENEILRSILANEKASAIHLDNVAIERARDAWFDNSGSFESRLRAAISAASPAPAEVDNWQQYAKEGETAQECIERHRAEQDALLKLYGRAAPAEGREAFEEFAKERMLDVQPSVLGGDYVSFITNLVWAGWKGHAALATAPTMSEAVRYIVIGYGESDYPQAAFVNKPEQLLDAVLGMIYTKPSDADDEFREAYRKDLENEDEWSEGIWSTEFEIGGIVIYDTGERIDRATTKERS